MLGKIKRKIKRYLYFLRWSSRKRLELVSFIIIIFSIFSGLYLSQKSFGKNPLGRLTNRLDHRRVELISGISRLKSEIWSTPGINRFDLSGFENYALKTLDELTTDELIYVKGELERETEVDLKLPHYPGSIPPPVKPAPEEEPESRPQPQPQPQPPLEPESPESLPPTEPKETAKAILKFINLEREKVGVKELTMNLGLVTLAQKHSEDMNRRSYFSHTTPEGITFPQRLRNSGFMAGGENLYYAGRSTFPPKEPVESWLISSGHKRIMLSASYSQVGVGVSGPYVTANFTH